MRDCIADDGREAGETEWEGDGMSSIFGWSYPPGCSGPPDDDENFCCDICGLEECVNPLECQAKRRKSDDDLAQSYIEMDRIAAEWESKE